MPRPLWLVLGRHPGEGPGLTAWGLGQQQLIPRGSVSVCEGPAEV